MQITTASIESIVPLTDSILKLILKPHNYIPYQAGQYLKLLIADQELSYSIANAPLGSHKYELHIRHSVDNANSQQLLAEIRQKGCLTLSLPFGDCHFNVLRQQQPVLFLAAGTGFAPIKAMIEQLLVSDDPRSFELFWGARSQSDLYLNEQVMQWQTHVSRFRYFSLLPKTNRETLVSLVLKYHPKNLKDWQIVIAGSFDMVYSARDKLLDYGLSQSQLFSDAFSFETKED